ncbi:unnamed protein product [Protopolystoma xenopodis]|uniref:Uncharacterized protein n=1 Tax=Protopolystoma xenopodis TaxID=117903 RepID=A0A3S5B602_9PLAT|nr:unnamed protein product [Protopolystoma xenopodis]
MLSAFSLLSASQQVAHSPHAFLDRCLVQLARMTHRLLQEVLPPAIPASGSSSGVGSSQTGIGTATPVSSSSSAPAGRTGSNISAASTASGIASAVVASQSHDSATLAQITELLITGLELIKSRLHVVSNDVRKNLFGPDLCLILDRVRDAKLFRAAVRILRDWSLGTQSPPPTYPLSFSFSTSSSTSSLSGGRHDDYNPGGGGAGIGSFSTHSELSAAAATAAGPTAREMVACYSRLWQAYPRWVDHSEIVQEIFRCVYQIYSGPSLKNHDLYNKLEQAFCLGLLSPYPEIRHRFLDLYLVGSNLRPAPSIPADDQSGHRVASTIASESMFASTRQANLVDKLIKSEAPYSLCSPAVCKDKFAIPTHKIAVSSTATSSTKSTCSLLVRLLFLLVSNVWDEAYFKDAFWLPLFLDDKRAGFYVDLFILGDANHFEQSDASYIAYKFGQLGKLSHCPPNK